LGIRRADGHQQVFIAGAHGVKAGRIGIDRRWYDADAPDAQHAAVFGAKNDSIFLTARQHSAVLISAAKESEWNAYPLPSLTAELTSVAIDPFDANRLYAGTQGEGIFIYEGPAQPYEAKTTAEAGGSTGGASWR
jgi:hypothetical protein